MANLQKIVKVTQAQYNILASGGRVGDYVGLDDKYIYFIEDTNHYAMIEDIYEEVTYSNLKSLRDNSQLVKGKQYRITDYTCTTVAENTHSAGHVFDIIVTADDVNKLNENARACLHTWYITFANNVTLRCYVYLQANGSYTFTICDTLMGEQDIAYSEFTFTGPNTINTSVYNSTNLDDLQTVYDYFQDNKLEAWQLKYSLDNDTNRFAWADTTNGKGVIYYMKDENGNECPYDFKNIMFKRYAIDDFTEEFKGNDELKAQLKYDADSNPICYGTKDLYGNVVTQGVELDETISQWFFTFSITKDAGETYVDYSKRVELTDEEISAIENYGGPTLLVAHDNIIKETYSQYICDDVYD